MRRLYVGNKMKGRLIKVQESSFRVKGERERKREREREREREINR